MDRGDFIAPPPPCSGATARSAIVASAGAIDCGPPPPGIGTAMEEWERESEVPDEVHPADIEVVEDAVEESREDCAGALAAIDALQQKKTSWLDSLLVLIFSGLLFWGIGSAAWNWKTVAMLIPILLFHELGHYLTMLAFGYRNLRMFF